MGKGPKEIAKGLVIEILEVDVFRLFQRTQPLCIVKDQISFPDSGFWYPILSLLTLVLLSFFRLAPFILILVL